MSVGICIKVRGVGATVGALLRRRDRVFELRGFAGETRVVVLARREASWGIAPADWDVDSFAAVFEMICCRCSINEPVDPEALATR